MINKLKEIKIKSDYLALKNIIFFLILLIIIFSRSPYIFIEGRFIEEEGSVFYRNLFYNGKTWHFI